MFIKTKVHSGKIYVSIAESYRHEGKIKQRTILTLGAISNVEHGALNSLIQSLSSLPQDKSRTQKKMSSSSPPNVKELSRLNWGAPYVIEKLFFDTGLKHLLLKAIDETKYNNDILDAIFLIVVNRFIAPSSKLKIFQNQGNIVKRKSLALQQFYRCLDFLSDQKNFIEKGLFERLNSENKCDLEAVLYDVTTLYFESTKQNNIKDFGYSKDCKFGEVQIVVGLLIDKSGRPITMDIFPGNTFEGNTPGPALVKLKTEFNIHKITLVADRGMSSKFNIKLLAEMGFYYVIGCKLRGMNKIVKTSALDFGALCRNEYETKKNTDGMIKDQVKFKIIDHDNIIKINENKCLDRKSVV